MIEKPMPDLCIDRMNGRDVMDLVQLVHLFQKVFALEAASLPPIEHYQKILADPNFIVVMARLKDQVIGGLTAYILPGYHSTRSSVYAYDLAVHPEHQRRGIGRRLMEFTMEHCRSKGIGDLFIQAELDDDDAIAFYRATNFSEELKAVNFSYRFRSMGEG